MARRPPERTDTRARLGTLTRRHSTATVLFHHAMAERLGLGPSDHKCLDLLLQHEHMTGSRLAAMTGLTTGAITGVVNRLEQAGFVRRAKDPGDRRRVIIEPDRKRMGRVIGPLFESMARAAAELCTHYTTEELAVIRDFTVRARRHNSTPSISGMSQSRINSWGGAASCMISQAAVPLATPCTR